MSGEPIYRSRASMDDTDMFMAYALAQLRSKDPRTKVGAIVVDGRSGGTYFGYNGFSPGYPDLKRYWDCRDASHPDSKYSRVTHGESNAVRKAQMAIGHLGNCTMFVTHFPCPNCMKDAIIPSGLRTVRYASDEHRSELSVEMAHHAGVSLVRCELPDIRVLFKGEIL